MMKIALAGAAALLVSLVVAGTAPASAQVTPPGVIGTEDNTSGLSTTIITSITLPTGAFPFQIGVASDGESPFDPYGFGADTSDGILLPGIGNISFQLNPGTLGGFHLTRTPQPLGFSQLISVA